MPTLNWIGKEAVVNHHQQVPFHLLRDVPELACSHARLRQPAPAFVCQAAAVKIIEGFAACTALTFILESKSFTLAPDPLMMDMEQSQPEMKEFPGIALNGQIGQPQPVDWPKILQLCQTFNRNLPNPIALLFVRVARDETRTNSLYYRLRGVEYP